MPAVLLPNLNLAAHRSSCLILLLQADSDIVNVMQPAHDAQEKKNSVASLAQLLMPLDLYFAMTGPERE